jgi:hypothetical protein
MLRRIDYRTALNAFVFTGLWFAIGAIVLWSPLPDALGIGGPMFAAWLILFFLSMMVAGSLLTVAALNAAFPLHPASPQRGHTAPERARTAASPMWAPPSSPRASSTRGTTPRDS